MQKSFLSAEMFLFHQLALLFTQLLEFVSANTMPGFHASIMFDRHLKFNLWVRSCSGFNPHCVCSS